MNTLNIQIASLKEFMYELQYDYCEVRQCFFSGAYYNAGKNVISFNTAVALHNGVPMGIFRGDGWCGRITFRYDWVQRALDAQIVKKVKLQRSHKKGVIVQDHRVKFVKPEYADMFIKEE